MNLVLRRKAIEADVLHHHFTSILSGQHPELRADIEKLLDLRKQMSQMLLVGRGQESIDGYVSRLEDCRTAIELVEAAIARGIPAQNVMKRIGSASCEGVAVQITHQSALIEFIRFFRIDFQALASGNPGAVRDPEYSALVLTSSESSMKVELVSLGATGEMDRLVEQYRASIASGGIDGETKLHDALFTPKMLMALEGRKALIVSPDAALSLVPFCALRSSSGELIASILGVPGCFGADVLDSELKRAISRSSIVHIATHGFYIGDADRLALDQMQLLRATSIRNGVAWVEMPPMSIWQRLRSFDTGGLRSGLATAGANRSCRSLCL
jgi:hypothetical protein